MGSLGAVGEKRLPKRWESFADVVAADADGMVVGLYIPRELRRFRRFPPERGSFRLVVFLGAGIDGQVSTTRGGPNVFQGLIE